MPSAWEEGDRELAGASAIEGSIVFRDEVLSAVAIEVNPEVSVASVVGTPKIVVGIGCGAEGYLSRCGCSEEQACAQEKWGRAKQHRHSMGREKPSRLQACRVACTCQSSYGVDSRTGRELFLMTQQRQRRV